MKQKVLTIKQPYAYLIAAGIKNIENLTWRTNYRGKILIHTGADKSLRNAPIGKLFSNDQIGIIKTHIYSWLNFYLEYYYYGAIIGSVDIVDCVINHPSIWAEKTYQYELESELTGKCEKGKTIYNWVLSNPVLFDKPILNVKGKLSLWEYDL